MKNLNKQKQIKSLEKEYEEIANSLYLLEQSNERAYRSNPRVITLCNRQSVIISQLKDLRMTDQEKERLFNLDINKNIPF